MSKSRARPQLELRTHHLPTTDGPGQGEKKKKKTLRTQFTRLPMEKVRPMPEKQKPRPHWVGLLNWTSGRDIGHVSAWELDPCALFMGSDFPDSSAWSWPVSGLQSSGYTHTCCFICISGVRLDRPQGSTQLRHSHPLAGNTLLLTLPRRKSPRPQPQM